MAIDYKKELETAAKTMILVHKPDVLIKMIVRMIVRKIELSHAGILLYQEEKDTYILTISRGARGIKIPSGFARMDASNPLIRFFNEKKYRRYSRDGSIQYVEIKKLLNGEATKEDKELLDQVLYQLEIFETAACVPSYFGNQLLGVLLLGTKKNGHEFQHDELDFLSALASDVAMAIRNAHLFRQLENELERNRNLFINTTIALATAIEAKDRYTKGHTERVTTLSMEIAKVMRKNNSYKVDDKFMDDLQIAALLHDIGKIGIPEAILNKQGALTLEEWKKMQSHVLMGETILAPIKELKNVILGVKYHHERFDGKGYLEKLTGDKIPLIAAIISVADSYDAMITDRPYRTKAKTKEEAIAEIQNLSGKQFHPQVVNAFLQICREGRLP
ncbi:MAG: hypothetical protein DRP74_05510 [Candidatus Omnitrophota bacterium]|nr:MAG: hypothetical protein DRP74_05510 [Candidatus Omnitrophota bacterium]